MKQLKSLVFKILPPPITNTLKIKRFKQYGFYQEMWGGGIYADNVVKALSANLSKEELANKRLVNSITNDLVKCYLTYAATPEEYFAFEFRNKSHKEREKYLTNMNKDKILIDKIGWSKIMRLRDKQETYRLLHEFFMRDVCFVDSESDRNRYLEFVGKHKKYFVKPIDGMCGKGAAIIEGDKFDKLLSQGRWIAEELVEQTAEIAQFNSSSINTVRLPTFFKDGKFTILAPFFRTGRKGSIVDNGGAGGIFAALDSTTGKIISDGHSELNEIYIKHPDTEISFKGFVIPHWNDLLEKAHQAHAKLSDQRYIAWDFALTPQGWKLIEANSMGQFLWQYATKTGVREAFLKLMN